MARRRRQVQHGIIGDNILIGYSKYFPGRFIRETGPFVAPELL